MAAIQPTTRGSGPAGTGGRTQLPDLIDKPLSWSFNVLPSGRSLGHSILFAALCGIIVWYVGQRYSQRTEAGAPFSGHLLHLIADMIPHVITVHWAKLSSLSWPLLPVYQYSGESERGSISYLFSDLDLYSAASQSEIERSCGQSPVYSHGRVLR